MQIPKHIIVAASAWGSRLVSIFVQFYSIRILLDLLGTDGYAVFTVTGSLVGWFLLADFGLGNSLQNQISHRRVNNQEYQDIILCAGIAIIPIFILLTFIVIFSSSFLSNFIFGDFYFLDNNQKKEIFQVASLIFLTTAIGSISFKIWFSEHKGWISNIIPAVSSIFGLILIESLTAKDLSVGNDIILAVYCFYIPGALIGLISFLYKILPSIKCYSLLKKDNFYRLLKSGGGFFVFSLLSALVLQVDYIIMSKTLIGKDVVTYNIMSKIFGLINFIYAALLQSLWPICAEASSRGQFSDFQKIEKRYIFFGFFIVLICAIFIYLLKDIILNIIATNKGLDFPLILIILFSIYHIVRIWTDTYSMFLLSIGRLKPLWISVPFQAMFSILFQWYGAVNYGLVGLLCGLILSFLVTVSWWLPFSFRYIVNRLTKEKCLDV